MTSILQRIADRTRVQRQSPANWLGRSSTRCIGIDLDIDIIRVSSLGRSSSHTKHRGKYVWNTYNQIQLPSLVADGPSVGSEKSAANNEIDSPQRLGEWISNVIELLPRSVDSFRNAVSISLPPSWTHYGMVRQSELAAANENCDAMFRGSIFRSDAHTRSWDAGKQTDHVMMASVAKQPTLDLARRIRSLGYEICGIFAQGMALGGAAHSLTTLNPRCVAVLGKDGGTISMLGCDPDAGKPTGLCRQLRGLPPASRSSFSQLMSLEDLQPWLDQTAQDIGATLDYANRLNQVWEDHAVDARPVMIAGDLAPIPGLDVAIASRIQKPVAVWRFASDERPLSTTVPTPASVDATAAVSLSLAHLSASLLRRGSR